MSMMHFENLFQFSNEGHGEHDPSDPTADHCQATEGETVRSLKELAAELYDAEQSGLSRKNIDHLRENSRMKSAYRRSAYYSSVFRKIP